MNKEINNIEENKKEIDFPQIINSEVNLLVFPFFALSTKGLRKKTKTVYQEIIKKEKKKINILWKVTSNPEYGYPGLFDREIYKAIEQIITEILKEKGKIENPIALGSFYNLCKRIGISNSGAEYRKIKESFKRIKTTSIEANGTFYNKEKKQWIEDIFTLYERVIFKGEKINEKDVADDNYLYLGSWYLQNLNSFYIKPIDYKYLKSLESKIASRLYEILSVKFYGLRNKRGAFICYRYSKLCKLLPVTPHKYFSLARQQLDPGNNELKNTGFISKFDWSENGKNDWLIYYWPGERAKKEMKNAQIKHIDSREENYLTGTSETDGEIKTIPSKNSDLISQLVDLNVSRITAERLVKIYVPDKIKEWIQAIDFTNADNKAAYLVKAIKENWQVPEEYLKEKESAAEREGEAKNKINQDKEKEEENKRKQEENQKLEQIYNSLNPLQQEAIQKEAESSLSDFWKAQLNKEKFKGKISKILQATLEEKKREIVKERITYGNL